MKLVGRARPTAHRTLLPLALLLAVAGCDNQRIANPSGQPDLTAALGSVRAPSIEVQSVADTFYLPCGTFTVLAGYTGSVRTTTFFDGGARARIEISLR